jgi:mannose-1-phosphate guanylyltransferase
MDYRADFNKAIVLSAGYGTRLGNLTQSLPKGMLPLEGRPLLAYILEHLAGQGFDDVAINLHYRPEPVRSYFGDGRRLGVRIHYTYEPRLLGTAGAIRNLASWLGGTDDFLVIYGDVLTNENLTRLTETHQRHGALATLLLHRRARSNSVVQMRPDGRITALVERPTEQERKRCTGPWVNSAVQILNRRILDHIPPGQAVDLPRDVYPKIVSTGTVYGVPLAGYRCAIDSPARYEEARTAVREGRWGWIPT